jgi:predicted dehydrogenase
MMAPAATFDGDPLQNVIDQQSGDGHTLRFLIQGTRGAAETDVFARTLKRWEFGDSPEKFISKWTETITWDESEDHLWFHNTFDQTRDVVRRVAQGLSPATPARDAYETMRLCFAAEESAQSGHVVAL